MIQNITENVKAAFVFLFGEKEKSFMVAETCENKQTEKEAGMEKHYREILIKKKLEVLRGNLIPITTEEKL